MNYIEAKQCAQALMKKDVTNEFRDELTALLHKHGWDTADSEEYTVAEQLEKSLYLYFEAFATGRVRYSRSKQ